MMRKKYQVRLVFRIAVLLVVAAMYVWDRAYFSVVEAKGFFTRLSALHLLWLIWLTDMVTQLLSIRSTLALGAAKQSRRYFLPAKGREDGQRLRQYSRQANRRVAPIFAIWSSMGAILAVLRRLEIIGTAELFLIAVFFYVCDLICVLYWCPFRVFFMKNRCCTTCRIFNWDHLMMFTPLISVGGLYCGTLVAGAVLVFLVWEYRVFRYPQRFYEGSNCALQCSRCTDLLCGKR